MSKIEDIFIAKRAIKDLKKICSHYNHCVDCPLNVTGMCNESTPIEWDISPMFEEKR